MYIYPLSFSASGGLEDSGPSNELVSNMMDNVEIAVDEKIEESQLQLFTSSAPIKASQVQTEAGDSRQRRKVVFRYGVTNEIQSFLHVVDFLVKK